MGEKIEKFKVNLNNVNTYTVSERHGHSCIIITYISGKQDAIYYKSIKQAEKILNTIMLNMYNCILLQKESMNIYGYAAPKERNFNE